MNNVLEVIIIIFNNDLNVVRILFLFYLQPFIVQIYLFNIYKHTHTHTETMKYYVKLSIYDFGTSVIFSLCFNMT